MTYLDERRDVPIELLRAEKVLGVALDEAVRYCADDRSDAARCAALVQTFARQVIDVHDPDAVATFLAWKERPVLDTILNLAAKLGTDDQHEVIDFIEALLDKADHPAPDCDQ